MTELARILAALSAAFLLRSALFLVAMIVLSQAITTGALAVRDAVLAAKVNDERLAKLEKEHRETINLVRTLMIEVVESWKRETAQRAKPTAAEPSPYCRGYRDSFAVILRAAHSCANTPPPVQTDGRAGR